MTGSRLLVPSGGKGLVDLRKGRKRPAGRVVIAGDWESASDMAGPSDYPMVINRAGKYNLAMIVLLPVLFVMPDETWAMDIGMQIAEAQPSEFWLLWPDEDEERAIWSEHADD